METLAYDLLLEAAMRAQKFCAQKLWLDGPWKWLLTEFADYYGVSDSYTKLRYLIKHKIIQVGSIFNTIFSHFFLVNRYLSHVMSVATPTKDCLELVHQLLVPVIKARSEKTLTRQEVYIGFKIPTIRPRVLLSHICHCCIAENYVIGL